jgi:alpha-methylacyl-CoA racemase
VYVSSPHPPPSGPLRGLKVLEIAGLGPGPFGVMLLADLGAEVVRVDRPGGGPEGVGTAPLDRGRQSVVIDLKQAVGVDVLLWLVETADVLVEGYRPGVAERLGFGPDVCLRRNPRLVYARMTGWGQTGPLAHTAGHDITYLARSGALHAIGRAGGPPQIPLNLLGDFGGGGMLMAFGICAALWERERSGQGQVIDAAIVDGVASMLTMQYGFLNSGYARDERGVNLLDSGAPFYDVYETADGGWMAVGAIEGPFFAELVRVLELTDLPDRRDQANWPQIRKQLAQRFAESTRDEWAQRFAGSDACVAPVLSLTEAPRDEQLAARDTYLTGDSVQPAAAPRFSRTPGAAGIAPARAGQHTEVVLAAWGIDGIAELIEAGVVVQTPTDLG